MPQSEMIYLLYLMLAVVAAIALTVGGVTWWLSGSFLYGLAAVAVTVIAGLAYVRFA